MVRLFILLSLTFSAAAVAQLRDSRLPISVDADFSEIDARTSMLIAKGLRLSQGAISIVADEGRASTRDEREEVWRLIGNVSIEVNENRVDCAAADLTIVDDQIVRAAISGAPATFEVQRPTGEAGTYAEADTLNYDLTTGTIEFSGNAKIIEGGNQIESSFLVYDIERQRIRAQGSDDGDEKVKITFTPSEENGGTNGQEGDLTGIEENEGANGETESLIAPDENESANGETEPLIATEENGGTNGQEGGLTGSEENGGANGETEPLIAPEKNLDANGETESPSAPEDNGDAPPPNSTSEDSATAEPAADASGDEADSE